MTRKVWMLIAFSSAACFTGADAEGLPCESDEHCGRGQSCIEGICGGPAAAEGVGAEESGSSGGSQDSGAASTGDDDGGSTSTTGPDDDGTAGDGSEGSDGSDDGTIPPDGVPSQCPGSQWVEFTGENWPAPPSRALVAGRFAGGPSLDLAAQEMGRDHVRVYPGSPNGFADGFALDAVPTGRIYEHATRLPRIPNDILVAASSDPPGLFGYESIMGAPPVEVTSIELPGPAWTAEAGSFNGDPASDVAVALADGRVATVLGGEGGFLELAAEMPQLPCGGFFSVVAEDFDRNGFDDLVIACDGTNGTGEAYFLRNKGEEPLSFDGAMLLGVGQLPTGIDAGDLDGDDFPDFVVADTGSNTLTVYLGDGNGNFAQPGMVLMAGTSPAGVRLADMDCDGQLDFVFASQGEVGDGAILIGFGDGNGGMRDAGQLLRVPVPGFPGLELAVRDFDEDGRVDIASIVGNTNGSHQLVVLSGV